MAFLHAFRSGEASIDGAMTRALPELKRYRMTWSFSYPQSLFFRSNARRTYIVYKIFRRRRLGDNKKQMKDGEVKKRNFRNFSPVHSNVVPG